MPYYPPSSGGAGGPHDHTAGDGGLISGGGVDTFLEFTDQGSDPSAPSAGFRRLYGKAGGLYVRDPSAIVGALGAAGGGGGGGGGTKYNPDHESPATTPAVAEEFNGSHGMAWDSAPATNDITNYPGFLRFKGSTAVRHLSKAWAPGATDISIVCKLSVSMGTTSAGGIGLYVGSATGDPADGVYVIFDLDTATLSLYNENASSFVLVTSAAIEPSTKRARESVYLRLTRVNAGPTWTAYISYDGITWYGLATTGSKALTIAAFGIRTDCNHDVSVDWVRGWTSVVEKVGAQDTLVQLTGAALAAVNVYANQNFR